MSAKQNRKTEVSNKIQNKETVHTGKHDLDFSYFHCNHAYIKHRIRTLPHPPGQSLPLLISYTISLHRLK